MLQQVTGWAILFVTVYPPMCYTDLFSCCVDESNWNAVKYILTLCLQIFQSPPVPHFRIWGYIILFHSLGFGGIFHHSPIVGSPVTFFVTVVNAEVVKMTVQYPKLQAYCGKSLAKKLSISCHWRPCLTNFESSSLNIRSSVHESFMKYAMCADCGRECLHLPQPPFTSTAPLPLSFAPSCLSSIDPSILCHLCFLLFQSCLPSTPSASFSLLSFCHPFCVFSIWSKRIRVNLLSFSFCLNTQSEHCAYGHQTW